MRKELGRWEKRDITPIGRITVLKTLILSKIVHVLISLPSPSTKTIKEINKMFFSFLWKNKPDPIKRAVAREKLINGGLSMIDIDKFNQSLKITWIRKTCISNARWKSLIVNKYPMINNILNFGNEYTNKILTVVKNPFWKDVMLSLKIFTENFNLKTQQEVDACSFLYNGNIKIGRSTIKNKKLIENNVHYIHQLKNGDHFLSHVDFNDKYGITINFLVYNSIITAIKHYTDKFKNCISNQRFLYQPHFDLIIGTKKGASKIYNKLIENPITITGQNKWCNSIGIIPETWINSFRTLIETTKETKLHWFQFRILHSILSTNRSVSKYNVEQNDACTFCGVHSETILHLLWQCDKVQLFWKELCSILNRRCTHARNISFSQNLVIFGQSDQIRTDITCKLIILMAKFYIYRYKIFPLE